MIKRKKEDHSRLMLLIAVFILGYIFFAGSGFSKTGQLTRDAYMLQQMSLDIDPHNIGAVKGMRQQPLFTPDVFPGGSPGGSDQQYITYGPFCGCPPNEQFKEMYEDRSGYMWVIYPFAPHMTQCIASKGCSGKCVYGNDVSGYIDGGDCRSGGAYTDVVALF